MSESLINLIKEMATKNMEDIAAEKSPSFPLLVFFRNQQRFIHLYLLSRGCKVTSQIIREIMESMGREFTSQTYYGLRRELEQEEWIDYLSRSEANPTGRPGVVEMPHYVYRDKLSQFKKTLISSETVSRPVSVSKYHLFDMGILFSDIQTFTQIRELQAYTQTLVEEYLHSVGEDSADDATFTLFYPDFIFRGVLKEVTEFATAPISTQEELQTVIAGVFDRLPKKVSHDHQESILSTLGGYVPKPLYESVYTKIQSMIRPHFNLNLVNKLRNAEGFIESIVADFTWNLQPRLLLLGQSDLIKPTPFFYTALREFPKEIRWPEQAGTLPQYEFTLLNYKTRKRMLGPIVTTQETHIDLAFSSASLDKNTRYEWQVYVYEEGKRPRDPWINGLFWFLSVEKQESLKVVEETCETFSGLIQQYLDYELYEEVIQWLTPLIEPIKNSKESIQLRSALSDTYLKAFNSCNSERVPFWSVGHIAELQKEESKQIECLKLGLYQTYQADGCQSCNKCGLVPQ